MVAAILSWVIELILLIPFGLFLLTLKRFRGEEKSTWLEQLTLAFFIGICAVTTLASMLTFFIKVSGLALGIISILALLQWIIVIRQKRIPAFRLNLKGMTLMQVLSLVILGAAVIVTLVAVTFTPVNSDTGLYHAQAIHWIEVYPVVPGLALLHSRFGFNSSWLVLNALFSFSFLNLQSFHTLPAILFLVSLFYFFSGLFSIATGSRKASDLTRAAFFIACLLFLTPEISSPGTDLPVTLITWFIVAEMVKWVELKSAGESMRLFWLSLITIFTVTIKLSAAPLLLIPVFWIVRALKEKKGNLVLAAAAIGMVLLLPFIGRNIIISGHLFYPGFSFDPIHLDWSIPQQGVLKEKESIHAFALLPRVTNAEFGQMTWQQQYKRWFFDQLPRHKAMLLFLAAALPTWLILLISKSWRRWLSEHRGIFLLVITLLAGSLYWLLSAPTMRFGYGYLIGLIVVLGVPLILFFLNAWRPSEKILSPLFLLIALLISGNTLFHTLGSSFKTSQLWLPLDYPRLPTATCEFGNFSIDCATQWQSCWYEPFPCAVNPDAEVYLRGGSFADGFTLVPK